MITCREARESASECADGVLDAGRRAEIEKHASGCPECATILKQTREMVVLVKTLPKIALTASQRAGLESIAVCRPGPLWFTFPKGVAAGVVMALLALVPVYFIFVKKSAPVQTAVAPKTPPPARVVITVKSANEAKNRMAGAIGGMYPPNTTSAVQPVEMNIHIPADDYEELVGRLNELNLLDEGDLGQTKRAQAAYPAGGDPRRPMKIEFNYNNENR